MNRKFHIVIILILVIGVIGMIIVRNIDSKDADLTMPIEIINQTDFDSSDEDKFIQYKLFFESELGKKIEELEQVNDASVILESNSDNKFTSVNIQLDQSKDINEELLGSIAGFVKSAVEGIELEDVTITINDK